MRSRRIRLLEASKSGLQTLNALMPQAKRWLPSLYLRAPTSIHDGLMNDHLMDGISQLARMAGHQMILDWHG
jgi:hypothetical protein